MNIQAIKSIVEQPAFAEVEKFFLESMSTYKPNINDPDNVIARNVLVDMQKKEEIMQLFGKLRSIGLEPAKTEGYK